MIALNSIVDIVDFSFEFDEPVLTSESRTFNNSTEKARFIGPLN